MPTQLPNPKPHIQFARLKEMEFGATSLLEILCKA
jgi:hypothetical protein